MNSKKYKITKLVVGEMQTNCYLISNRLDEVIIIDPGDDAEYISRIILDKGLSPKCILLTHGHSDHHSASTELKLAFEIPILMNTKDQFLLRNKNILSLKKVDFDLKEGEFSIDNFTLKIIHTPGHTPGSMSIYLPDTNSAIVGDLLFSDGRIGGYDTKYADKQTIFRSIKKLKDVDEEILIYPGHGETFVLSEFEPL